MHERSMEQTHGQTKGRTYLGRVVVKERRGRIKVGHHGLGAELRQCRERRAPHGPVVVVQGSGQVRRELRRRRAHRAERLRGARALVGQLARGQLLQELGNEHLGDCCFGLGFVCFSPFGFVRAAAIRRAPKEACDP